MALVGKTASTLLSLPFKPEVTGTLLYLLTRGPVSLKDHIIHWITSQKRAPEISSIIKWLKVLLALGLTQRVNTLLADWAYNGWKWSSGGQPFNWPKEVVVITGGSGGIGIEMVRNLARKGVTVAILDLQAPPSSLSGYTRVHYYETDITSPDSVNGVAAKIKAELGTPSVLMNNAGVISWDTILNTKQAVLETTFKVNVISHWYLVQAFLPDMIAQKKGHIVTTASMASYVAPSGLVDYSASKAAILAFHEGLRQELKHRYKAPFIKMTSVHPSYVNTTMTAHFAEKAAVPSTMTPEYVAKAVTDAVLSGKSGQILLPPHMSLVSGIRGWPVWLQEIGRDTQSQMGRL